MSLAFARSLTELFRLNSDTRLDDVLLNRILTAIEGRLKPLEAQQESLDTAIAQVRQVGLTRINEVLTPALQAVFEIQERGFLVARSASEGLLGEGNILTLVVDDADERALFTPSPFTALTRASTPDDYAIARTIAFDKESGEYLCEVVSFAGDPGPHDDWVIGALAGPTLAMLQYLADGQEARDDAAGSAASADGSADAAQASAVEAAASAASAQGHADDASTSADAAANSAAAAATFDPSSYYLKGETDAAIVAAVQAMFDALIAGAPGALDTLNELAAALGDDPNFAATVTAALAGKLAKANNLSDLPDAAAARGNLGLAAAALLAVATTAQARAGTAAAALTAQNINNAVAIVGLADAATIAIDWQGLIAGDVTLAGNRTLGNPTNVVPGSTRLVLLKGNSATMRTLTFGSNYKGQLPTLTDITSSKYYLLTLFAYTATHIVVSSVRAL